jgi:glucose/arabinose dehydrogenase
MFSIARGLFFLVFLTSVGGAQEKTFSTSDGVRFRVETVLTNLEIPWSIVFDHDGNMFFTERPGRLSVLRKGAGAPTLIATISEVRHIGEGGLMGLALHPDFKTNRYLYLSYTFDTGSGVANGVFRYTLTGDWKLSSKSAIVPLLPGSRVHNGCRIRFGPDGKLYITTGDAAVREIAQDPNSLGGKTLRVNDDGTIPFDNPNPRSPIFAVGFRNAQGIDWHPEAGLQFQTEHGPSGFDGPGGGDEVNIVEAGKNYGWPVIHHRQTKPGYEAPLLEYTPAVAPGSGSFYRGDVFLKFKNNFFFGGLRGQRIQRIVLDPKNPRNVVSEEALLQEEFQRIRDVVPGPDGYLYFSTSNRDGRARPAPSDDRIMRIVPTN